MKIRIGMLEINFINHTKEIKKLIKDGRKIAAVKYVKDLKGWDLRLSKVYVDLIQHRMEGKR